MAIYTIGGDDYIWGPDGRTHSISNAISVDFEAAAELAKQLYKSKNPPWAKVSEERFKSAAKESDLSGRLKQVRDLLESIGVKTSSGKAIVIWGPNRLANASINSGNMKTGPTLCTNAAQASCPSGTNNRSGFRCPLYGSGCYAESGPQAIVHTSKLNRQAGVQHRSGAADATPEEVAEDEAQVLRVAYPIWKALRINNAVRLHVVGDCVTPRAVAMVSDAVSMYSEGPLQGPGTKSDGTEKNVWNYTHGWRDIPRSQWSERISVLASCDSVDQLPQAHELGYGCSVVVPDYLQNDMGEYRKGAYDAGNGFKLLPCPYELRDKNNREERVWCTECKLCLKDELLRRNKTAIAFAAHGSKANTVAKNLVNLTVEK
jgi:hypothetical protein